MTRSSEVPRCLVVIGEDLLARFVDLLLNHGAYERRRVKTVAEATDDLRRWRPHLAIVELGIEEGRGIELIGRANSDHSVPIVALAPRGGMRTRLEAFERGADDVLVIPFPPEELVARSLSLVKRRHGMTVEFRPSISLGELELDILAQKVCVRDRQIELTPREQSLLYVLAAGGGQAVTREQLLQYMYGDDAMLMTSNVIDRHVSDLRRKLGGADTSREFIETAPGGYVLRQTSDAVV
jgi:DNA-binding response OmpR family regulator